MSGFQQVQITTPPTDQNAPPVPAQGGQPAPEAQRPGWLPEKFKSPEDLAAAYQALESKFGQRAPEKPAEGATEQPPVEQPTTPGSLTDDELTRFNTELAQQGALTDESYKLLEGKGFPRQLVDQYVEGLRASASQKLATVFEVVGGQDEYTAMMEWAATGLTREQALAYNRTVESGDLNTALLAVQGLHAQYTRQRGSAPRLIQGQPASSSGTAPYRSKAEMIADMKNPRYKTDPAFRADVEARLASSNIF